MLFLPGNVMRVPLPSPSGRDKPVPPPLRLRKAPLQRERALPPSDVDTTPFPFFQTSMRICFLEETNSPFHERVFPFEKPVGRFPECPLVPRRQSIKHWLLLPVIIIRPPKSLVASSRSRFFYFLIPPPQVHFLFYERSEALSCPPSQ